MNKTVNLLSKDFFEAKYKKATDPWDFVCSSYEQRRHTEIIRALGSRRFQRTFEPGCSIGVLTERLAAISDEVVALDISPTAAARARARCAKLPHVSVTQGSLPGDQPQGFFDLIIVSEIGYYFSTAGLSALGTDLVSHLTSGGLLLAAHWLGSSEDHLLRGDEVHEVLAAIPSLVPMTSRRFDRFRLDLWSRR